MAEPRNHGLIIALVCVIGLLVMAALWLIHELGV